MRRLALCLLFAALLVACGGPRRDGGIIVTGCIDGQSAACTCSDGRAGSQQCSGGAFGGCVCTGNDVTDAGTTTEDAGFVDSGVPPRDAGFTPGRDAGFRDAGFTPPRDAGFRDGGVTPPPRDAGFPPPRDAGFPPPRDGGVPNPIDGGADNVGDPCVTDTDCNIGFPLPLLICVQNMCQYGCLFNELQGIPCPNGTFCDFASGRCI